VADRFHVARHYRDAADELRKQELHRLKKELSEEAYKALKGSMHAFRKNASNLNKEERKTLRKFFGHSASAKQAYALREQLTAIFDMHLSKKQAQAKILGWIRQVQNSGLHCFDNFLNLLQRRSVLATARENPMPVEEVDVEMAARKDGTILAIRAKVWANLGAYLSTASTGIPTILHGLMLCGAYDIKNVHEDVYGVFTNTTPTDAYRGAGRPEATFMVERLVDLVAQKLKMDPAEIRMKNFIPPFTDGHPVATGLVYDSGNYAGAFEKTLTMLDYTGMRKKQAELRRKGEHIGIGFSTYAEICGLGPSQVAGAVGFGGGLWESAIVRFHPSGKVNVFVGISPHGQGHETTFAQIVSDQLGVPVDDVEILHGDTDQTPMGWGSYGSRSTPVGSGALMGAIRKIKEKAKIVTAHLLEAAPEDIEYADGKFFVKGVPAKSKSIQDIALMANVAWNYPKGLEPGLEASAFFDPENFVYPFGAHAAVVRVDFETGEIKLERYVAVDDCGRVINPMIVEGQIHGGIVQGIGQALWEGAVYDGAGQLLTGSMMDYALPKADAFPIFELAMTETPTKVNPLGVKGIGETGTIASTPAIYNAVIDALSPLGAVKLDMPLTPERVWNAIRAARR
jgi:carbon-monoxide dehydrogenase large subunit